MPDFKHQDTAFYLTKKQVRVDFSAGAVSSDGGAFLLHKAERTTGLLKGFAKRIPDWRNPLLITHSIEKQVQQRVYLLALGYEDCNDAAYLKNDPVLNKLLSNGLGSQPTLCRFENHVNQQTLSSLQEYFLEQYVKGISGRRKRIVIDVDSTDDPTHGNQQLSLFNGHYDQYMYQEVLLLDGESGQVIMPALLSGTGDCREAFIEMLRMVVIAIRLKAPHIEILVRGDAGFSCPEFYLHADLLGLKFCLGVGSNNVLKPFVTEEYKRIQKEFREEGKCQQVIIGPFAYQAKTWNKPEPVYAKVEATKEGMNTRFIVSNIEGLTGEEIYWDFYVLRGDTCENRLKELKNMCSSDRLSCQSFQANFFRLMLSCLAYEAIRYIKERIKETTHTEAMKWQVNNVRLFLFKVGALVKEKVRTIQVQLSSAFPRQALFRDLLQRC